MSEENQVESTEQVAVETQVETPANEQETEQTGELETETAGIETPPPEPKKKTAQERIAEITRARREAEREKEYWRKVALDREAAATPPAHTKATPPAYVPGVPERPTLDQFETTTDYENALLEWHDMRKSVTARAEQERRETESAFQTFQRRADKVRQEYEDFDDVIEAPVFSPSMQAAILHSEHGPTVAYHLGTHQDVAERIRNLPERLQAYEIGKLETQLLLAKSTKKVPSAPPPIAPVGMGAGTGGGGSDAPPKDIKEWMEWDKQRTIARLKQRTGG